MHKSLFILSVTILLLVGCSTIRTGQEENQQISEISSADSLQRTAGNHADWKTYSHPKFQLSFPKNWRITPLRNETNVQTSGMLESGGLGGIPLQTIIFNYEPLQNLGEKARTFIEKGNLAEAARYRANADCAESASCPEIFSVQPLTVDGVSGQEFIFQGIDLTGEPAYSLYRAVVKDGAQFIFWTHLERTKNTWTKMEADFREILGTFKFKYSP